ncbi:hypothetical protein Pyn_22921 [Prunus yedoensis var. nudiflora]|uniref:Uncharacterized protein n=1 Tax=Prunus yedoensis var. nudiflora TaxID=2094558 RepID=A0A314US86_PRUYE|nr:hypothetical protein Pyn_22921 [Prunus yedoensis var. nudiflora]
MEDTATSSCKSGTRSSAMADSIRRQREEEENNRRLREQAWDTGVFTRRADTPVGAKIFVSPTVSSNSGQGVNHVIISGEEPRPDEGDVGFVLDLNASVEEQVQDGERGDCAELQARGDVDGGISWSLTQNSDPFNLGPLIVAAQGRDEGRLKRKGPDSMWERDDESVRYDKRFRSGDQGGCSRTSGTSGQAALFLTKDGGRWIDVRRWSRSVGVGGSRVPRACRCLKSLNGSGKGLWIGNDRSGGVLKFALTT